MVMSISERHDLVCRESGEFLDEFHTERVLRVLKGSEFALDLFCLRVGDSEASERPSAKFMLESVVLFSRCETFILAFVFTSVNINSNNYYYAILKTIHSKSSTTV